MTRHRLSVDDFMSFVRERESIRLKRERGDPRPWTDDVALRRYRFTNIDREHDTGTRALRALLTRSGRMTRDQVVFTCCWYRLFNKAEHAHAFDKAPKLGELARYVRGRLARREALFTRAHRCVPTRPGLANCGETVLWMIDSLDYSHLARARSQRAFFESLNSNWGWGTFFSYQVTLDVLPDAPDDTRWSVTMHGSARGLELLGLVPSVENMRPLLQPPMTKLSHVEHALCEWSKYVLGTYKSRPFDKIYY